MLKQKYKNRIWYETVTLGLILVLTAFFIKRDTITNAITDNIRLCFDLLIPALFPAFILSYLLTNTGLPFCLEMLWRVLAEKPFGFPGSSASATFLGFIAGYPIGVKNAVVLYRNNVIKKNDAKLICLSCVHPGIAFCVLVVGNGMFSSMRIGWSLYFSVLLSDLFVARILFFVFRPKKITPIYRNSHLLSFADLLINAVEYAIRGMTGMCGWILVFCSFQSALFAFFPKLSCVILPIAEVTNASLFAVKNKAILLCAFSLGFGGVCLAFQLLKDLRVIGVSMLCFLICRFISATLSLIFEYLFLKLFPIAIPAFQMTNIKTMPYISGVNGTVALLFTCLVFMIDLGALDKGKTRKTAYDGKGKTIKK